jgi:SAM-dependent methyltransferase|tara:strand:+ start:376 stop:1404 length:1029 start_codon:yes stop_codon:yes gene_type:complete
LSRNPDPQTLVPPISDVRQISHIAYGFIASKVLFATLNAKLFDLLADGPRPLPALADDTGIAEHRLDTLLTACVSLGLMERRDDGFINAPASQQYLVTASPRYFGDYLRFQIDRQVYPLLTDLDQALVGKAPASLYDLMADPKEAEHFTRAQHVGSLGPATVVQQLVDLSGATSLLDVAGGSGAFSITLCRRFPRLHATILDFPTVALLAEHFIAEANLSDRIRFIAGDALDTPWPDGHDAVLLSYLLTAVKGEAIPRLARLAYDALRPGGQLFLHDFVVNDDRQGPTGAALWFVAFLFNRDAVSFTPSDLTGVAETVGFRDVVTQDVIPGLTRLVIARKPA